MIPRPLLILAIPLLLLVDPSLALTPPHAAATGRGVSAKIWSTRGGSTAAAADAAPSPSAAASLLRTALPALAAAYSGAVASSPVAVKALTAGTIFAASEAAAQAITRDGEPYDHVRNACSFALGLCYFGPAAHYWYDAMFRIFPPAGWASLAAKTALGQVVFGPVLTVIFFGVALAREGKFSAEVIEKEETAKRS